MTSLLILKGFWFQMTSFILKLFCRQHYQNICWRVFSSHQNFGCNSFTFLSSDFAVKMVKKGPFSMLLIMIYHLIKDSQNILGYTNVKHCPISSIQVKCSQFDWKMSDIFLTCPSQILPEKFRGFLISLF